MMKIDFQKMQGLVPAIVQDAAKGDILMLGFMNQEAWDKTASGGYVTFYSRTRNQLWTKGETSGNRLVVNLKDRLKPGAYTVLVALALGDNDVNPEISTMAYRVESGS